MSWHHTDCQHIIQKAQVSHIACKMHKCKCVAMNYALSFVTLLKEQHISV